MYNFYKTDIKITGREGVIRQLTELESTNAKVEISRISKNGKYIFICKISDGKIVRIAEGNSPEAACDSACDAFMRDLRKSNKKTIDKKRRINKKEINVQEDINNI